MGIPPVAKLRTIAEVLVTDVKAANVAELVVNDNELPVKVVV